MIDNFSFLENNFFILDELTNYSILKEILRLTFTNKYFFNILITELIRKNKIKSYDKYYIIEKKGLCNCCNNFTNIKSKIIMTKENECHLCSDWGGCGGSCGTYRENFYTELYCNNCSYCKECYKSHFQQFDVTIKIVSLKNKFIGFFHPDCIIKYYPHKEYFINIDGKIEKILKYILCKKCKKNFVIENKNYPNKCEMCKDLEYCKKVKKNINSFLEKKNLKYK